MSGAVSPGPHGKKRNSFPWVQLLSVGVQSLPFLECWGAGLILLPPDENREAQRDSAEFLGKPGIPAANGSPDLLALCTQSSAKASP